MAKILLIEDDSQVRETLQLMLEKKQHQVTPAANGVEGLEMLNTFLPDVVITDILMPEKEGLEVIRELRITHPVLPVIAISGGGMSMGPELCLRIAKQLGAQLVLMKPFTLQELNSAIEKVLSPLSSQ
ncbi:MAG: response regulator [Magnetococcales bacterium]|nr:response regulator [Magnetococcales bacterium]NGZ25734.1 response regulator [Magnetococcales bacterium]